MNNRDYLPILLSSLLGAIIGAIIGFSVACLLKDRAYRPQLDKPRSLLHSQQSTTHTTASKK